MYFCNLHRRCALDRDGHLIVSLMIGRPVTVLGVGLGLVATRSTSRKLRPETQR